MRTLEESHRVELLLQAARTRLESKAAQMLARARDAGWEQALWEGLFRALGYKNNAWPMQRLAEIRSRWCGPDREPLALQARLLGIAGLLPAELSRANADADGYLRQVWDLWWRERDSFSDCILPRAAWRLSNLRPANHPQRRIALAAHWMSSGNLPSHLERWLVDTEAPDKSPARLLSILQCPPDAFWSSHWTLRSARMPRPQPLLGTPRVSDLAVNAILPWLRARTAEGNNDALEKRVEHWYFAWPAGEDNARLRQARLRFLDEGCRHPGTAAVQQGLMQIQRDFCDHSDAACKQCRFPELVRKWKCQSGAQPDGSPPTDLNPRSTGRTDC
jgi:hypothetical protein